MLGLEQQLAVVKDLPSPEGRWELLEMIGKKLAVKVLLS